MPASAQPRVGVRGSRHQGEDRQTAESRNREGRGQNLELGHGIRSEEPRFVGAPERTRSIGNAHRQRERRRPMREGRGCCQPATQPQACRASLVNTRPLRETCVGHGTVLDQRARHYDPALGGSYDPHRPRPLHRQPCHHRSPGQIPFTADPPLGSPRAGPCGRPTLGSGQGTRMLSPLPVTSSRP